MHRGSFAEHYLRMTRSDDLTASLSGSSRYQLVGLTLTQRFKMCIWFVE